MKILPAFLRWSACGLLAAAGLTLASARVSAAEAPAAPAPAPKAAAGGGTIWYVFTPPAKPDEVLASPLRVKLLAIAKTFLDREDPALKKRLSDIENPFYAKQPPPPEPVVAATTTTTTSTGPAQPVEPPKKTDEDKLMMVGDSLQPTGMLEGAGRRLITFSGNGGGTLEVGKSFSVTIPPDSVPVTVQLVDANENSCVLKLNTTTVTVNFFAKSVNASRPPPSTSPSQPTP